MFKWLFKKKGCAKHMNNKLEVIRTTETETLKTTVREKVEVR